MKKQTLIVLTGAFAWFCSCDCAVSGLSGDASLETVESLPDELAGEDDPELPPGPGCEEFDGGGRLVCIHAGWFYMGAPPVDPFSGNPYESYDDILRAGGGEHEAVSYTHLTLPTILRV